MLRWRNGPFEIAAFFCASVPHGVRGLFLALALFAVALEEDFGDVAERSGLCTLSGGDFDFDVGKAGDGAAIDADEVGVFGGGVGIAGSSFGLKPPSVVAGVKAGEKAGVGELYEAAVESRFIVALRDQRVCDVSMADGFTGSRDVLQHCNAGSGGAKAGGANAVAGVLHGNLNSIAVHGVNDSRWV